jgi:hypothetical protein
VNQARIWAIEWARELLEKKDNEESNWIILNVQGISTDTCVEPVQIAVIDGAGTTLFNRNILPLGAINPVLPRKYRIYQKQLKDWLQTKGAPSYAEVHDELWEILGKYDLMLVYGEKPTLLPLYHAHALNKLPSSEKEIRIEDVRVKYARFYGEWDEEYKRYRLQELPKRTRESLLDCRIILELVNEMAEAPLPKFAKKTRPALKEAQVEKEKEGEVIS